jgi:hypothetical protein
MQLELQPDEAELLKTTLTNRLSNLRMEIAGTENFEFRQGLKDDEETIKAILARLDKAEAPPA